MGTVSTRTWAAGVSSMSIAAMVLLWGSVSQAGEWTSSLPAAVAAECAGRQGRFWEFFDLLYAKQEEWAKEGGTGFAGYAKDLGLEAEAFSACLKDPAVTALIETDVREGNDRWVVSTPTFFINAATASILVRSMPSSLVGQNPMPRKSFNAALLITASWPVTVAAWATASALFGSCMKRSAAIRPATVRT